MSHRNIAKELARKHGVKVKQGRYREDGRWYHHLNNFPAAFFDKNGYILFLTKEEYENCTYLSFGQDVNIRPNGISAIPGYILYNDKEAENSRKNQGVTLIAKEFTEGALEEMTIELRKRNPQLKEEAILAYGTLCQICGFDFHKVYGELGKDYIELHHIRPLSETNETQKTTINDVTMVCSNCHRMLHRNGKNALSIEKLIEIVKSQKSQNNLNIDNSY